MGDLMEEMAENQTFGNFKKRIDQDLEDQEEFELLRIREKELNNEIKQINENLKKKQDDFAQEA